VALARQTRPARAEQSSSPQAHTKMFEGTEIKIKNPMVGVTEVRVMRLPPQSSPAYPPCCGLPCQLCCTRDAAPPLAVSSACPLVTPSVATSTAGARDTGVRQIQGRA